VSLSASTECSRCKTVHVYLLPHVKPHELGLRTPCSKDRQNILQKRFQPVKRSKRAAHVEIFELKLSSPSCVYPYSIFEYWDCKLFLDTFHSENNHACPLSSFYDNCIFPVASSDQPLDYRASHHPCTLYFITLLRSTSIR
jgi:hypothetical protein